ncbi:MAG: 3-deoxy-manno-octulosonate cytidylyltransferase [Candidatus Omnitrophota bacterium]|nr:3-deoxy-manno-octulosonate cytidylyltransferase [Candidatus Omnitrophota bacterium]MBU1929589.1 3-deoxy-manno-octulosonate cytidylyltransferase [Candidatus Omnitrophota bacterium]MBU2034782.1 3-deoxy-manno-octulosonate cytidylyltransferase [Candidatus Omnitrophota bacterium]MBU2221484.1 3-deoxy-manno-octulosonate cytidylyltransferase [Candidatus Omnitrophota bacterium]MBU2257806.1 3-deoxy-manno-octulosonate cytidylyltransferase [Candidatus Omnitrophota bacterium]
MDVIGVIPARYSSTRFAGKVLADILGKPMLQHVWERSKKSLLLDDLIIACDEDKVAEKAREFGAKVVMTSKGHVCGTDRIAEVVNPLDVKVIINIQADEPLIHPSMIDSVAQALLGNKSISMATLMKKIESHELIKDPNIVKVVVDMNNFALYFSRAAIPFRAANSDIALPAYYKHIGLYGYTKDFLFIYKNLAPSNLERIEKLEQLRVLEEGYRIKVIETKYDSIGVDTPEDLEKVEEYLKAETEKK